MKTFSELITEQQDYLGLKFPTFENGGITKEKNKFR